MQSISIIFTKLFAGVVLMTAFSSDSYSQNSLYNKTYYVVESKWCLCHEESDLKKLVISAQNGDRATYKKLIDDDNCSNDWTDIPFKIASVRFQGRIVKIVSPLAPYTYLYTVPDALGLPQVLRE